jgi:hypothetical protein
MKSSAYPTNIAAFLRAFMIAAFLVCTVTVCVTVRLVSDYDEQTEKGATDLQKQISTFFVRLPSATPQERRFDANQSFYQQAVINLNALQVRAGGLTRNSLTQEQLQLVEDNLAYLALLHKGCISGSITPAMREAIREHGVDTSLDCRVEFGASQGIQGRGSVMLNPALVGNLQGQFDQALGAVIALEMAKRRGEGQKTK